MESTLEETILAILAEGWVTGSSFPSLKRQLAPKARLEEFEKTLMRLLNERQVVWTLGGGGLGQPRRIILAAA